MIKLFSKEKPIATFTSKSGKEVQVVLATMDYIDEILIFVNRLIEEDTFLNLMGKPKTLNEETLWLKGSINSMKNGNSYLIWAYYDGKIIGSCEVVRQCDRSAHTGKLSLMIDRDYRRDGLGKFLFNLVIRQAQKMGLRIISLDVFSDNIIAVEFYKKFGFKEFGRLPDGLYRKNKYSDLVYMYKKL